MQETQPKLKVIHGHAYATSIEIAKRFHKEHKNVLRDIERIVADCTEEFNRLNFEPVKYRDRKGEMRPSFNVTRNGFAMVAMGFTGSEAIVWKIAFLTAFNEMEAELQRRNLRDGHFEQMNLFPHLRETIASSRPTVSVTAALTILGYEGLMIPLVTRPQIIAMIKRGRLEGFNDGRTWHVFQDSFDRFLASRRLSVAKAA